MRNQNKRQTNGLFALIFNKTFSLCIKLQGEHSAILSTFIKLPFVIKIFVLSIFEWPFYTDFTVSSVAYQAGLNLAWSQILRIGFLVQRCIYYLLTYKGNNSHFHVPWLLRPVLQVHQGVPRFWRLYSLQSEMTCLSSYSRLVGGLSLGSLLPRIRS